MRFITSNLGEKLFKISHALILPLSVLILAGIMLVIGDILIFYNFENHFTIFLIRISQTIFHYMPFLFGLSLVIYFTKINKLYGLLAFLLALIIFYKVQEILIHFDEWGNIKDIFFLHHQTENLKYFELLLTDSFNLKVLNTSYIGVFGIAFMTILIVNKTSNIELPNWLWLFNRERSVPFFLIPLTIIFTLLILLIWPYLTIILINWFVKSTNLKYEFNTFFYGLIKIGLKPFGINKIFKHLILETEIGGNIKIEDLFLVLFKKEIHLSESDFEKIIINVIDLDTHIIGQNSIWNLVTKISLDEININGSKISILKFFNNFFDNGLGNVVQDYGITFGLYPSIGLSLILLAPKNKRKQLAKIILPVLFISIFIGINEPFEFIILFSMPIVYFGFCAPLYGLSLIFQKMLGIHIQGSLNNQGLFEFIVNGITHQSKGNNWWVILPLNLIQYFSIFLILFSLKTKLNFKTFWQFDPNSIFFNKKNYKELVAVNYFNKKTLNQLEKNNSLIGNLQSYVIDNIKSNKWKEGQILPSEKALAIKFNCSRFTVRNALLKYVEKGILKTQKGRGYFVDVNMNKFIDNQENYDTQNIKLLKFKNVSLLPFSINDSVDENIKQINLNETNNLERKFFNKDNQLKIYEIMILKKNEFEDISNNSYLDQTIVQSLSLKGVDLTKKYHKVIFTNDTRYRAFAQELGWNLEYPLIISVFMKNDEVMVISLKILLKSDWNFSSEYKIMN